MKKLVLGIALSALVLSGCTEEGKSRLEFDLAKLVAIDKSVPVKDVTIKLEHYSGYDFKKDIIYVNIKGDEVTYLMNRTGSEKYTLQVYDDGK